MSRLFLLLVLLLSFAAPAAAQNTTCATRPTGDSSNACASTAFVNNGFLPTTGWTPFLPLIGNTNGTIAQGGRSGNTTNFATVGGAPVNGNCVSWNSGNIIDAGAPCGSGGGGSGTVSSGLSGQLAYYPSNGTTVGGTNAGTGVLTALGNAINTAGGFNTYVPGYSYLPSSACTGSDDTSAISAAITATPTGGTLIIPVTSSGCKVSSGFTITKPMSIRGAGLGATIVGTLGSTTDLFTFQAQVGGTRGISVSDLTLSITNGRSLIVLDTNTITNSYMAEVYVARIQALGSTTLSGSPIWIRGSNGLAPFNLLFENNDLYISATSSAAGYYFAFGGDTMVIKGGIITGPGYAIFDNQESGAGNLVVTDGTNITACGGILISNAISPILRDFEMEAGATCTSLSSAFISIGGGSISNARIGPGQMQILSGATGYSEDISLSTGSDSAYIGDGLRISGNVVGVVVGAGATNTKYGIIVNLASTPYSDSSASSVHVTTAAGHP